jgi:hypothetical protein
MIKAWMVEIGGRKAITFASTRSRGKWIAVRSYWEAGYRREWPKLKVRRAREFDGCLERDLDSRAWNPDYLQPVMGPA